MSDKEKIKIKTSIRENINTIKEAKEIIKDSLDDN